MIGTHDGYWFALSDPNDKGTALLEVFRLGEMLTQTRCHHARAMEAFDAIVANHRAFLQ